MRVVSSIEEAAAVLRAAHAAGGPVDGLLAVGAATKTAASEAAAAVVCTGELDGIVEYSPADLTVTVEAGTRLDALNSRLAEDNLRVALDPPGYDAAATVGGVLAANDAGPLRLAYGGGRDNVLGMTLLLADGTRVRTGGRVVKNVAGYALHRLLVGSWGGLAMIATATLRLRPRAEALRCVVVPTADARQAERWTAALLAGPTRPALLEWLRVGAEPIAGATDSTREFGSAWPGGGPTAGAVGSWRDLVSTRPATGLAVIVGFEGDGVAVDWQVRAVCEAFRGGRALDEVESGRLYRGLREWPAGAGFRAALPSGRLADFFDAAADGPTELLAHAGSAAVFAHGPAADGFGALARATAGVGGTVVLPRGAAQPDHAGLRARLRAALRSAASA